MVGGRGAGTPALGGNEESKLEPSKTELEAIPDRSTPQVTVLALSPAAFCISTPEIHTPQECGLDILPKLWPWAVSVENSLNSGMMHNT